jgi:hypothetical protein
MAVHFYRGELWKNAKMVDIALKSQ